MRRFALVSLTVGLGLLIIGGGASAGKSRSAAIVPSPTYTTVQLGAPAGDDWMMHMGNLKGSRYSSLTQISKTNVSTLKEAWHIHLGTCLTHDAACGSLEGNAVVAGGTYYFQAPKGDVFTLDGATGAQLWKW